MQIAVVSLFPEMVRTVAEYGVVGRAIERQLAALRIENPRDYATDTHRTVDDRPYGGGPGMVLKYRPAADAIRAARAAMPEGSPVIYLSPSGREFDQGEAARLAALPGIILFAGRYEGVDERVREHLVDGEISVGDVVLAGGEVGALLIIEAVGRLVPGVLGNATSTDDESFADGLLEYPHYTRPADFRGWTVPDVLRSGDHAKVARWRRAQALRRTIDRRPDLIEARGGISAADQAVLDEFDPPRSD